MAFKRTAGLRGKISNQVDQMLFRSAEAYVDELKRRIRTQVGSGEYWTRAKLDSVGLFSFQESRRRSSTSNEYPVNQTGSLLDSARVVRQRKGVYKIGFFSQEEGKLFALEFGRDGRYPTEGRKPLYRTFEGDLALRTAINAGLRSATPVP